MSSCALVWAHALHSSVAHEDELALFDWEPVEIVARLFRYDSRGHGGAEPQYEERAYRWSALVDDMLYAAPQGPFVAAGIGMGAVTALYAALRARRRVQGLVLALPPTAWHNRQADADSLRGAARLVETRGLTAYLKSLRDAPGPTVFDTAPGTRELAARHLRLMDEKALPAMLRGAAASDLPTREEIRNLCIPTLILAADGDSAHPVSTAAALAELMVMSELHVVSTLAEMRDWPSLIAGFVDNLCLFEREGELPTI